MSKQSIIDPDYGKKFGIIKQIQTSNFELYNTNEIVFHPALNLINSSSIIDKIIFNYILKLFLNPDFKNKNKKIELSLFNVFQKIKLVPKKDISFSIVLVIPEDALINVGDYFRSNFLKTNELTIQVEINIHRDVVSKLYNGSQKEFETLTPHLDYELSELLYGNIWIDHAVYPYLNSEKIFEILNYGPSQLFDFFLYHLNLGELKKQFLQLKEKITFINLEKDHFSIIKHEALEKKEELESELKILKKVEEIEQEIKQLEMEKEWSVYFDLKSKFQSKTANIDQITLKLPSLFSEKEKLESLSQNITVKLRTLHKDLDETSIQYENQRKDFLSEKALLDKIDRNLKDWDKNVTKTEKDLKFKSMRLADKEKKLKDLNTRISKESTESLLSQKDKLEKEIAQDNKEISNLQQTLQAIQNEKNLKSKERTAKEKNSQAKSAILADLSSKITNNTESISENQKELEKLQERIQNINVSIEKYQNEIEISEKDIKELDISISNEMESLKSKNLDLPSINRSVSTLNVLQNQLISEKNKLLSMVHSETNFEFYSKHLSLLGDLESEFKKRDVEYDKLTNSLIEWQKNWNSKFKEEIKKVQTLANELLKTSKLSIDFFLPGSDKPDEGILGISIILYDNTVLPYSIHFISSESITSIICIIFSLFLVNKSHIYISDFIDIIHLQQLEFQTFLTDFSNRLDKLKNTSSEVLPQMIFFLNKGVLPDSSVLSQYSIIN